MSGSLDGSVGAGDAAVDGLDDRTGRGEGAVLPRDGVREVVACEVDALRGLQEEAVLGARLVPGGPRRLRVAGAHPAARERRDHVLAVLVAVDLRALSQRLREALPVRQRLEGLVATTGVVVAD